MTFFGASPLPFWTFACSVRISKVTIFRLKLRLQFLSPLRQCLTVQQFEASLIQKKYLTSTMTLPNNHYDLYCNSSECFLNYRKVHLKFKALWAVPNIPHTCLCMRTLMHVWVWQMTYRDWREWRFFRAALGTVFSWLFCSILKVKWKNYDFRSKKRLFFALWI